MPQQLEEKVAAASAAEHKDDFLDSSDGEGSLCDPPTSTLAGKNRHCAICEIKTAEIWFRCPDSLGTAVGKQAHIMCEPCSYRWRHCTSLCGRRGARTDEAQMRFSTRPSLRSPSRRPRSQDVRLLRLTLHSLTSFPDVGKPKVTKPPKSVTSEEEEEVASSDFEEEREEVNPIGKVHRADLLSLSSRSPRRQEGFLPEALPRRPSPLPLSRTTLWRSIQRLQGS